MEYSTFLDLNSLSEEARNELESFYEYLIFKYRKKKKRKPANNDKKEKLENFADKHLISLPEDYIFNRDEIHER